MSNDQVRRRPPPLVSPVPGPRLVLHCTLFFAAFAFSLLFWFPTFHPRIFAGVLIKQVTGKFLWRCIEHLTSLWALCITDLLLRRKIFKNVRAFCRFLLNFNFPAVSEHFVAALKNHLQISTAVVRRVSLLSRRRRRPQRSHLCPRPTCARAPPSRSWPSPSPSPPPSTSDSELTQLPPSVVNSDWQCDQKWRFVAK